MKGKVGAPSSRKPGAPSPASNQSSPKRSGSKKDLSLLSKPKKSYNPFKSSAKVSFVDVESESHKTTEKHSHKSATAGSVEYGGATTNIEVLSAQIVSSAIATAALQVKRQAQRKCIKADARALAWKCIANAALEISV